MAERLTLEIVTEQVELTLPPVVRDVTIVAAEQMGPPGPRGEKGDQGIPGAPGVDQGVYDPDVAYVYGDIVSHTIDGRSGLYFAVDDVAPGEAPLEPTVDPWKRVARDGADGADGAPGDPGADGDDGADGVPGEDGREVELQKTATHVQWRYVGDPVWMDLVALVDITGPAGAAGAQGPQGPAGVLGVTDTATVDLGLNAGDLSAAVKADSIGRNELAAAVETDIDNKLPLAGGALTGPLQLAGDPSADLHPVTRQFFYDKGYRARFRSGQNYVVPGVTSITNNNMSANQVRAMGPFIATKPRDFDRIGIDVQSAGAAGILARLMIYADDGFGAPGALVLDAGTVLVDTTGVKEITIAITLHGAYWLAAKSDGTPVCRGPNNQMPFMPRVTGGSTQAQAWQKGEASLVASNPFDPAPTISGGVMVHLRAA